MKKLIFIFAIIFWVIPGMTQTVKVDLSFNTTIGGKQDLVAAALLYDEINYYRDRNGSPACSTTQRMVKCACRWSKYMMDHHIDQNNTFYKHSTFGPDSLQISGNSGEIIHLIYFNHKPSSFEAAFGLLYGLNRGASTIIGWSQSPGHNAILLQSNLIYYGASVYIAKKDIFWVVYGTVNMSYEQ